jgi:flagellar biosynthesis GTPase FlhF
MESIVAKRELGNGRWDKALKRNMVELSVADNYDDAKEEWIATGEVWWAGNEDIPDWVSNSQMGQGKCLCGHIVVYHFQIVNTENGVVECVGSDHINTYLIMRAIAEDEGISIDAITDEKIQNWIDVRTKSMKAEAWWKANGAGFEMMFDSVKEMDLYFNVHTSNKTYYNPETQWYENETRIRKRAEGQFGTPEYKMASIVWRWNHPDNPKAQINTTGYPNDNLMKDLSLFYVMQSQYLTRFNDMKAKKEQRIAELAEQKRLREERLERERIERQEREAERLRIYNLPENVEKRRLEAIEQEKRRLEHQEMLRIERLEREKREQARRIEEQMQQEETLSSNNAEFENMCGYYGIPVFDETMAGNDWEREFLASIKSQMLNGKTMTDNQLRTLGRVLTQDKATEKQINYLRSLGFTGETSSLTKMQASKLIEEYIQ